MKIIIFGTGEIAELAHYYITNDEKCNYEVVAFVADDEFVKDSTFKGLPLIKVSEIKELYPPNKFKAHVALSYNKLNKIREEKYNLMKNLGYELVSYVCSKSIIWNDLNIGDNCFILENQTIQPTVKIGNNVMIWSTNHLGHNCEIEDHAYLASGITVSGHTKIGKRCFVGVNASFKDFINIKEDCFITMGAIVTRDINPNSTVTSNDIFESDHIVNKKLKMKYFNVE
jgi:sugar O-acyltransferase (sialic acid O-acetyltransferase NeuD family)